MASDDESADSSIDTSSSDSPSAEDRLSIRASPIAHKPPINGYAQHATRMATIPVDSDDDVSMSAESDDESTSAESTRITPGHIEEKSNQADSTAGMSASENPKKRKLSTQSQSSDFYAQNGAENENWKRVKALDTTLVQDLPPGSSGTDKSLLPAEIWHHIFTFCRPRVLGSLLRVNKTFYSYLVLASDTSISPLSTSTVHLLSPSEIWRASRRLFMPSAPSPLTNHLELDMWKLAYGHRCQFCRRESQPSSTEHKDQWHPGPGGNGVMPVWIFGMRTCGSCLKDNSIKEIDLLLSSTIPSPLMAAMPFIFLSNELHVITPSTLQAVQHPPSVQITKYFSRKHVEDIKEEFQEVQKLGSAAAEEWLKGLDSRGKERRTDAARWEKWETSMKKRDGAIQDAIDKLHRLRESNHALPLQAPHLALSLNQYPLHGQPSRPISQATFMPSQPPPRFDSPSQSGFPQFLPRQPAQPKQERTKEQVAELKAARRTEIERRCMLLDPPLTAGVLSHMTSFQAAIQIIQPLTDSSWEVLKPRLLSQRDDAERREKDRINQMRPLQERTPGVNNEDLPRSNSKDLLDREWDDIQAPLRARIGGYADEIIRDGWNAGDKVNFESAPQFAAEVLMYTRKRFYAEIAKDEAALRATSREPEMDPPNGPYTKILTLENMKWIFDSKIKPITELHRKELFLCNACDFHIKYYGFEGIIQHYAAKHTSSLSIGTIVVHWKSEWPQYPPFNPEPNVVKASQATGPTANGHVVNTLPANLQQSYGYGGYQPIPVQVQAPPQGPPTPVYHTSPVPYFGHPQFDQYSGHQQGPYAPPQYPPVSHPYQALPTSSMPLPIGIGYEGPGNYPQTSSGGAYAGAPVHPYPVSNLNSSYPPTSYDTSSPQGYPAHPVQQYSQAPSYTAASYAANAPLQVSEQYRNQLQQLAQDSRDIWNTIAGVKEVPGSVKVYTVIYHVLNRFRTNFQEDPPLSMLVDGLNHNKDMRPVRNVNGLVCKACALDMPGSTSTQNKKHFSFPQLVNHFHTIHEEGVKQTGEPIPDWTKDMVELPEPSKLHVIPSARGMDDKKLKIFGEALPEIFSRPAPDTTPGPSNPDQNYYHSEPGPNYLDLAPSLDNHDKYYTSNDTSTPADRDIPYDAEEYDPRNPRDLVVESRPFRKSSLMHRIPRGHDGAEVHSSYQHGREEGASHRVSYYERPETFLPEERYISSSSHARYTDRELLPVRDGAIMYADRRADYVNARDGEYVRRKMQLGTYEEVRPIDEDHDHRAENSQSHLPKLENAPPMPIQDIARPSDYFHETADSTSRQHHILDVVAQIQQRAKAADTRQSVVEEVSRGALEPGEVSAQAHHASKEADNLEDGRTAAERFLEDFHPGESGPRHVNIDSAEPVAKPPEQWKGERKPTFNPARNHATYGDHEPGHSGDLRSTSRVEYSSNGLVLEQARSRQSLAYPPKDSYVAYPGHAPPRGRSPELVDRRYKLNNVVYRDERQSSVTRRTPSRYARYESVRLENDREDARSASPMYIQSTNRPTSQYRERSPGPREQIYRARSPLQVMERDGYTRAHPPRQEVYRVYSDDPRFREREQIYEAVPAPAFEYVRISDPQGDYMIRRPVVRRQINEPVYVSDKYAADGYSRGGRDGYEYQGRVVRQELPLQERQRFVAPQNHQGEEEEYDPRHPEPVGSANASSQRVRYQ